MTAKFTAEKAAPRKKAAKPKAAKRSPKKKTATRKTSSSAAAAKKKKTKKKAKAAEPRRTRAAAPARSAAKAGRKRGTKAKRKVAVKKKASRRPRLNLRGFRRQLQEIQSDLLQSYMSAKGNSRSRESDGTEDYIDYAVSSYDREFLLSLTELEQQRLKLVDEALKRLDRGGFGLCVQCNRPIAPKRLAVQAWARYCLRCQELADSGVVGPGGEFPEDDPAADEADGADDVEIDGDDEGKDDTPDASSLIDA